VAEVVGFRYVAFHPPARWPIGGGEEATHQLSRILMLVSESALSNISNRPYWANALLVVESLAGGIFCLSVWGKDGARTDTLPVAVGSEDFWPVSKIPEENLAGPPILLW